MSTDQAPATRPGDAPPAPPTGCCGGNSCGTAPAPAAMTYPLGAPAADDQPGDGFLALARTLARFGIHAALELHHRDHQHTATLRIQDQGAAELAERLEQSERWRNQQGSAA
ncbi:hypothetical protein [Streptacidiphilus cavernicola]|uniref:Uncharacterized protein n=1 Tax=Streptacidiphilus cavernicola TaxID=3342716 RepID=A0ABV6VYL6_9ACTN